MLGYLEKGQKADDRRTEYTARFTDEVEAVAVGSIVRPEIDAKELLKRTNWIRSFQYSKLRQ